MDKIIVGNRNNGSLGDMCFVSSLFRHFEGTVELHNNDEQSKEVSVVFDNIANVEFLDLPKERIDKNCFLPIHRARKILISAGITDPICIPYIKLTDEEIKWGHDYVSKFKNPIIFVNNNAGCFDKSNLRASYVRPPVENIQFYVDLFIKLGYTPVQFSPNNKSFVPLNYCINITNLNLRQGLACFYHIKRMVAGDSGLYHSMLGVCNDSKVVVSIPEENIHQFGYDYSDLLYKPENFENNESRVYYIQHNKFIQNKDRIIDFLMSTTSTLKG